MAHLEHIPNTLEDTISKNAINRLSTNTKKIMNNDPRHILGQHAEDKTCEYLQKQGLHLIKRNYYCRLGEIDLIMRAQNVIVFVEVRMRSRLHFMKSLESITRSKQLKIIKTAALFLQEEKLLNKVPCRFDVVGVLQRNDQLEFEWIKQAFQ